METKKSIESGLLKDNEYLLQRQIWDREIKQKQKEKAEFIKNKKRITATEAKQTDEYKSWNTELLAEYAEKVDALKTLLSEKYQQAKQEKLQDYPIFMAIAEEIGYDASGRKTDVNELEVIGAELKKFIEDIN